MDEGICEGVRTWNKPTGQATEALRPDAPGEIALPRVLAVGVPTLDFQEYLYG